MEIVNKPLGLNQRSLTSNNSLASWGKSVQGNFKSHESCEKLAHPGGSDGFFCDRSSCVVNCKPGYYPGVGNPR